MARSVALNVVISGDASQLNRAFMKAGKDVDQLEKRSTGMSKRFGASMKFAGAAAAGSLVVGLKGATQAAIEAEKSQAKLQTQLKASGINYREHAKAIDASIQATSKLSGLDDEDLADSFTNIVRVTGDVNQALKLNGLAADFARAKNIDVAKAGEIVGKVAGGNTGILSKYGISVEKGSSATEALGLLQKKFAGQAEAYGKTTAGATDRAKVGYENLQEVVGAKLAPTLAKVANRLADLAGAIEKNPGAFKAAAIAVGGFVTVVGGLLITAKVATAVGVLRKAMVGLNLAFLANPIVLVSAAIVAFGAAVVIAYKRSDKFRAVVDETFRVMKSVVGDAISFVLGALDKYLGGISSVLSAAGEIPGVGGKFKAAAREIDGTRESLRSVAKGLKDVDKQAPKVKVKIYYEQFGTGGGGGPARALPAGDGPGKVVRRLANAYAKGNAPKAQPLQTGAGKPSGSLMGADSRLGPFARIGAALGLRVSSGKRAAGGRTASNGLSYHGSGEAIDLAGSPGAMTKTFRAIQSRFGSRVAELIHTPMGYGIKDGRKVPLSFFGPKVNAQHYNHVHVALDLGAPGPGIGGAANYKATGDGLGRAAAAARAAGFRGSDLVTALAIAGAESSFNAGAQNLRYPDHSIGLWQINQLAHKGRFGSDSALKNPGTNARAAYALFKESGFQPWSTYTNGAYRSYVDRARAAVVTSRSGSSASRSRGSAPSVRTSGSTRSLVQRRESHGRAVAAGFSRALNDGPSGLKATTSFATAIGGALDTLGTQYGQLERKLGQTDEDLGTESGRTARLKELAELKRQKTNFQTYQKAKRTALTAAVKKLDGQIRSATSRLDIRKGKKRLTGQARTALREDIREWMQTRMDHAAELAGLDAQIVDTQLDIEDLGIEEGKVTATPNTAVDAPEAVEAAAAPEVSTVVGSGLSRIDLMERAGELSAEAATNARKYLLGGALEGKFGALSEDERLSFKADLKDLTKALEDNKDALVDSNRELAAAINRQTDYAERVGASDANQMKKWIADVISGEIGGSAQRRSYSPGVGSVASY